MQISIAVPYDERRLRQTLTFALRPQVRAARIGGLFALVLGTLLILLDPALPLPYLTVIIGLFMIFGVEPFNVSRSMRMQARAIRDGRHITLDDEWLTVTYPLAESRYRWAGLDTVIETPETWYAMFGRSRRSPSRRPR